MSDGISEEFIGKLSTLLCSVCAEVPSAEVVQCHNGHSMCIQCSEKIIKTNPSTCPTCHVQIGQDHIRNYQVEAVLDGVTFNCPNKLAGCAHKMSRREISDHSIACSLK